MNFHFSSKKNTSKLKSKSIIILSCYNVVNSNSAGEYRIKLYIKSLLLHKEIEKVYLYYSGNTWVFFKNGLVEVECGLNLKSIQRKEKEVNTLIYPSSNVILDIFYLVYLRILTSRKIFLELNEVRKYSVTLTEKKNTIVKIIKIILSRIQDFIISYYDGIITISDNISLYYSKRNSNILQIPILSDIPDCINAPIEYVSGTPFVITFTGTVNIKKENLDVLIEAISKIAVANVNLHLYGKIDSYNHNELKKLIELYQVEDRVFYKGAVAQNQLVDLYKQAHLLILPRGNTKQNRYGFSTKLAEYMVSGRPTLVTNVSDNGKYIVDQENGFIVEPDSADAFVQKIRYIHHNYNNICALISHNALQTAKENFDYKLYTDDLATFLLD